MTRIIEISKFPTCTDQVDGYPSPMHESCLRAYQILEETKRLLREGVPSKILLEIIDEMEQK